MGKLFEKVILKMIQSHTEARDMLNGSQFGFHARHSTTLHYEYMKLMDHVALNLNSDVSMVTVFSLTFKRVDKTWHLGLLHKLHKLKFSTNLINLPKKKIHNFCRRRNVHA
jgi:hypothetical protein